MATETQTQQAPPEVTAISRLASIPLVSSSLESIHTTLTASPYLRSPYNAAQGLSSSAYRMSAPIQVRLAPLIVRADGYANAGLNAVESRYPYPFKAKPEEVASYVRETKDHVAAAANKTIDEKIKTPAQSVAQGIDQRFAPIVDYFEVAVNKLGNTTEAGPSSPSSPSQYQYQRAYALSLNLKDQLFVYSNDQLKQLQAQSVLVQRATETAHTITTLASSSLTTAQTRVHALSDNMLAELQKLQTSLHQSATSLQQSSSSTTTSLQQSLSQLSTSLSSTISDFGAILKTEAPLQEKVGKLANEVKERISPLLGKVSEVVSGKVEANGAGKRNEGANGHT